MPIYEYVCADCHQKFEQYVRAWNETVACPGCAGDQVEKQLSAFAFGSAAAGAGAAIEAGSMTGGGGSCCGRGGCGCH